MSLTVKRYIDFLTLRVGLGFRGRVLQKRSRLDTMINARHILNLSDDFEISTFLGVFGVF
jgi:hypothetical protein